MYPYNGLPRGQRTCLRRRGCRDLGSISDWEDTLEKEMTTHSSILTWEILRTEEPGGSQPLGSQKSWTRPSKTKQQPIQWNTTQQ